LCAPTLYKKLRELKQSDCEIYLFEYDKRFAVLGQDFVFYDYNEPLNIPAHVPEKSFDVVFADPPFLNEECLTKLAETVEYLMKDKLIICTGLFLILYFLCCFLSIHFAISKY
jgi:16S rRNA G966 N2-methylase RsmD